MKKKVLYVFLALLCFSMLNSQEALKSIQEEYYSFLSLQGITESPTLGYRTLSDNYWVIKEDDEGNQVSHVWQNNSLGSVYKLWANEVPVDNWFTRGIKQNISMKLYGPELFNSFNTAVPYGQNDGALWQGRGYNTSLTTGARFEGYGFELTIKPQISFSQNLDFSYLPGAYGDTHSYNWIGNVDLVQRYGDSPLFTYDWGDSEIRYTWNNLTIGFGNQLPWMGPAYLNPMLGSNNSASYTKLDIGLRKTEIILPFIDCNIGHIEGRLWLGMLEESKYFDNDSTNDKRMLNAMTASYHPSFIPGFTIGVNRIFLTSWEPENFKYFLRLILPFNVENRFEDQKVSVFADWTFPDVGFNVYGELGIDDATSDLWTNPFHSAIYTIGVKQAITLNDTIKSELVLEWNNFEMSQDFQLQWEYLGYCSHSLIKQGYTQKGQIIGAGTGFFGNSQFLKYKIYYPKGCTAFIFHRHSPNNNSIYSKAVNNSANQGHSELTTQWYQNFETYWTFGLESTWFIVDELSISAEINYARIFCYNYNREKKENNFHFALKVSYMF